MFGSSNNITFYDTPRVIPMPMGSDDRPPPHKGTILINVQNAGHIVDLSTIYLTIDPEN